MGTRTPLTMKPLPTLQRSLLLLLLSSLPSLAEDPSMFRGNLQHTGVYEAAGVAKFSSLKWKFHTAGVLIGSPAVSNGRIYFGSTDGNLYAVDAESGAQQWKFEAKSRIPSSPAVSAGIVYFTAYDGNFYAVDASTGVLKWKFQTGGERRFAGKHLHGVQPVSETMPDPFDCYLSSPVVWRGAVYFGSGDGNVYSLNAASGTLNWKFKTGDVVHASPAIANGTVFIGSWDSFFYALDASTGKEKWRFKTGDDPDTHNQVGIQSSAAVVDGMVYFGCRDSHLYALDANTGRQKWAYGTDGSWVVSSPSVRDGKVYFATSDSSLVYELDAKSGVALRSLGLNHWYLYSSPALVGGMLYVGSTQGKLVAIDLASFNPAWSFQTDGTKEHGPDYTKEDGTPNGDAIYVSDFYDEMVAGVGRVMSMGAIISSPVAADNVVFVASGDGNLYALR
jgi:eukaryotic-like serine/threonine-protein kinase